MKLILFAHGGSGNHGCEALVRGTNLLAKDYDKNIKVCVATYNAKEDIKYGIDDLELIEYNDFKKYDPLRYVDKAARVLFKSGFFRTRVIKPVTNKIEKGDICLSIGGDNYSYINVIPHDIINVHNEAINKSCLTILWGCSINAENIKDQIKNDLLNYDFIYARESLTYNELIDKGFSKDKVRLTTDVAFVIEPTYTKVNKFVNKNHCVGINISPIVTSHGITNSVVLDNYKYLIDKILEDTEMDVLLIPHVIWEHSNDIDVIAVLQKYYPNNKRVIAVDDMKVSELKGVISKCRIFIGARTHSTIAAYSTCVPTLAVGYSVKARGIAKDLFGTSDNYVISSDEIEEVDDLYNAYQWILKNESEIKSKLIDLMPDYKKRAFNTFKEIMEISNYEA